MLLLMRWCLWLLLLLRVMVGLLLLLRRGLPRARRLRVARLRWQGLGLALRVLLGPTWLLLLLLPRLRLL